MHSQQCSFWMHEFEVKQLFLHRPGFVFCWDYSNTVLSYLAERNRLFGVFWISVFVVVPHHNPLIWVKHKVAFRVSTEDCFDSSHSASEDGKFLHFDELAVVNFFLLLLVASYQILGLFANACLQAVFAFIIQVLPVSSLFEKCLNTLQAS